MFFWQWRSDSVFFELATTPKTAPTPTAAKPTPATTTAATFCPSPRGALLAAEGGIGASALEVAGAAAAGASSSLGIDTVMAAWAASRVTLVDHVFLPGAVASIWCGPGSTGAAVPQ